MNRHPILLLLATALSLGAAPAFVTHTGSELQSAGDFNGDGRPDLIILDVASGAYRIGYGQTDGTLSWVSTRSSSVTAATGLGIGRLNSLAYDSIAVTGPEANRVNILDANNTATAGLPSPVYIPAPGPNQVVAIDIGGASPTAHDDLFIASRLNSPSLFSKALVRNTGTTNRTMLATTAAAYLSDRANAVLLHTNRPAFLAQFHRLVGASLDNFNISTVATGAVVDVYVAGANRTPAPYDYVYGHFDTSTPYTQFLLYPPGQYYFFVYRVSEPSAGNYQLSVTNSYGISGSFRQLYALPGTNGTRLMALMTNETTLVVYRFDGIAPPAVIETFEADPGEHFTGAGVLPNFGFTAYSAPVGQSISSRFKQFRWNGQAYTNVATGDLPRASRYSGAGNVMQFRNEPFVSQNPVLLRLNNAGDWTSRPTISGAPASISVQREQFLSPTQGLAQPVNVAMGPTHPLAAYGLGNQYSNMISLFSFTPPLGDKVSDVSISPPPGTYPNAVDLQFTSVNASDMIQYRIANGPWISWIPGAKVTLFTNATVLFYGQPLGNAAKSAIQSANYAFTAPPGELDSDLDGVPDFVEIAKGLDPNGGRDSDGDGFSDLEEFIRNRNPLDKTSVPTNFAHLDDQAAFDLRITARPLDGFSNRLTYAMSGITLHAHDFQGSLLSTAVGTNPPNATAVLAQIHPVPEHPLVAYATAPHFAIETTNPDKIVGRELISLAAVPALKLPEAPYTLGNGALSSEAQSWILSASNTYRRLPRVVITNRLDYLDPLRALLVERKIATLLGARGFAAWTNLTLFPFRVPDATRTNPPQSLLLSLQQTTNGQPAFLLTSIFSAISNRVQNGGPTYEALRSVAQEVYRISSVQNNTNPAQFASPVDALRRFIWTGTLASNYVFWCTNRAQFSNAFVAVDQTLNAVPSRPMTNLMLIMRPDTLTSSCRILDTLAGGGSFALYNSRGVPFSFPENFDLPVGSRIQVSGYADIPAGDCGVPGIEVTAIVLASVPIASDEDADGNLLIDTWENQFFGMPVDPFADRDSDGYQNLQEMLEGSDPFDFYGRPTFPVTPFSDLTLGLTIGSGQVELHFAWPDAYQNRFLFGVRHSPSVGAAFSDLAATGPFQVSPGHYKMMFEAPADPTHFYFLTVRLK